MMTKNIFKSIDDNPAVYRLCMALILVFAGAVRIIHFVFDPVLSRDGVLYVLICRDAAALPWVPPLYIKLAKLLHVCGVPYEFAGLWISMMAGILLIIPAMKIAELCLQKRIWAVAFGIIIALAPKLIDLSIEVQRDSLYLLESALVILFMLNGMRGKTVSWGFAGFFIASAIFTRVEGFEFILSCMIAFLALLLHKERPWRILARECLLFFTVLLLMLTLYAFLLDDGIISSVSHFHQYFFQRKATIKCL